MATSGLWCRQQRQARGRRRGSGPAVSEASGFHAFADRPGPRDGIHNGSRGVICGSSRVKCSGTPSRGAIHVLSRNRRHCASPAPEVIAAIPEGLLDVAVIPSRVACATFVGSESHTRSGTSGTACVRLNVGRVATGTGEKEHVGMHAAADALLSMACKPADCRLTEWERHHAR
jgi:hypothetical protein